MFIPLQLTLRPSRICKALMVLVLALALTAVWLAEMPVLVRITLVAALLVAIAQFWRRHMRQPLGLRISQSGELSVQQGNDWRKAEILGQPVAWIWLIYLRLKLEDGTKWSLRLWPDSADEEGLRRLRVSLKWGMVKAD